jgi:hypothetical protein
VLTTTNPYLGSTHWYAENLSSESDQYLQLETPVLLDANSVMSVWHWYDTETFYDGGVIEISNNGGTTWLIWVPK